MSRKTQYYDAQKLQLIDDILLKSQNYDAKNYSFIDDIFLKSQYYDAQNIEKNTYLRRREGKITLLWCSKILQK